MLTQNQFDNFMTEYLQKKAQQVLNARLNNRDQLYTFTIDLSVAVSAREKKYRIDKPFKAISFEDATTNSNYVNVQFDEQLEGKSFKKFKDNSGLTCETMFNGCTIYFPAQTGSITCTIYYDCEYTSGALLNSGTINVAPASAISVPARVVADDTGAIFIPANSAAKKVIIENAGANDIKFGGVGTTSSGAATDGITLTAGAAITLDCNADVYTTCAAGLTSNIQYVYLS
jgi:hypothetical protein